jgi:hypothetical protein
MQFQTAKQAVGEDLDDWADRITTFATKAYKDLPDSFMYDQAVLQLCLGCADKDAGEQVANLKPKSMNEAIDGIKWVMHTHRAIHGRSRQAVRTNQVVEEEVKVRASNPIEASPASKEEGHSRKNQTEERLDRMTMRFIALEAKVDKLADQMKDLIRLRRRSISPRRRENDGKCFKCGEDHFMRNCPTLKAQQEKKPNPTLRATKAEDELLNEKGSDQEA